MKTPKFKYPTRNTIKRLCRSEVEERIVASCIELPPVETDFPVWWLDEFDDLLDPHLTAIQYAEVHAKKQKQWMADHKQGTEHPGAREALFSFGLRMAIKRASLTDLNFLITARLMDLTLAPPGFTIWSHWQRRTATRLQRENAVFQLLDWMDRHAK